MLSNQVPSPDPEDVETFRLLAPVWHGMTTKSKSLCGDAYNVSVVHQSRNHSLWHAAAADIRLPMSGVTILSAETKLIKLFELKQSAWPKGNGWWWGIMWGSAPAQRMEQEAFLLVRGLFNQRHLEPGRVARKPVRWNLESLGAREKRANSF